MTPTDDTEDADPLFPDLTPEVIRQRFNEDVAALGGQTALAVEMSKLGDRRPSTLRSIQRMAAGDTRVSGEMRVVVELLMRKRWRAEEAASRAVWRLLPQGGLTTSAGGFTITLSRQTKGRWRVLLVDPTTGVEQPTPNWQPSVEEAKIRAMLCVEEALDHQRYNERLEAKLNGIPKT